ncbi:hypothetical protein WJX74_010013 [Apatococcus lobatus]|uniref:Uncharacterized protein n=1 Tax=Apatococcus lobatus TaxID=904363 RepID=A0AAW1RW79_9CHLO
MNVRSSVNIMTPSKATLVASRKSEMGRKPSSVTRSAINQASEAASTAAATTQAAAQNVVPGSVDAPIWAIALATLGVTVALGLSTFLFKPGFDASQEIQNRDRKSGRFK